jgi:Mn2+/Fe2+ NRAMP family transporter
MKKALEITPGILTSIGGFLDVGAIAPAADAGAGYGFQLIWGVLLATVCIIFLIEMVGRLAAVSHHTVVGAIRERFGFDYFIIPLCAEVSSNFLLLGAETGGVCLALQFLTGVSVQVWVLPVAFAPWLFLWKGTFGIVEKSTSLLGLITLCFVGAAVKLHPHSAEVGAGFLSTLPTHYRAHYWFTAVAISRYASLAVRIRTGIDSRLEVKIYA